MSEKTNQELMNWYIKENLKKCINRHENKFETPHAISFLVTNRCNLKCKHCFYHKTTNLKTDKEMTIDEYAKLSENLDSFFYGMFCGGEPFIREDFHEIVNLFRANNNLFWAGTTSNGQLTTSLIDQVEKICKFSDKAFALNISLEGKKDYNDDIRGNGSFDKAIYTWKEAMKLKKIYPNLALGISTTMTSINQDHLIEFFDWAIDDLKPDAINLLLVRQDPRAGKNLKLVEPDNYKKTVDYISDALKEGRYGNSSAFLGAQNLVANREIHKTMLTGKKQFHCYAGKHGAFIDYNGDVNVCEVFPDEEAALGNPRKMGNLREYDMDFEGLWNSPEANRIRSLVNEHSACQGCTHETEGYVPSIVVEPNILAKEVNS